MHVRFRVKLLGGHWHVRVFVGQSPNHTLAKAGDLALRSRRNGRFTNTVIEADELEPLRHALATAPGITFDLIDEGEDVAKTEEAMNTYADTKMRMERR